jgi:hypothetical protein
VCSGAPHPQRVETCSTLTARAPRPLNPHHSYGVHNQELSAKMRYKLDNSTVTPEVNVATQHWRVQLDHKVSNQDRLEAVLEKGDDPRLAYIRNQDGVELRLEAPVRSDIAARASIRVQRTFEL